MSQTLLLTTNAIELPGQRAARGLGARSDVAGSSLVITPVFVEAAK